MEAEVREDLFSARGAGREDYAFGAEFGDGGEGERLGGPRKRSPGWVFAGWILGWIEGGLVGRRGFRWG